MTYRQYTLERDSLTGEVLVYKINLSAADGVDRVERNCSPTPFIWSYSEQMYTPKEAFDLFKKACIEEHLSEIATHSKAISAITNVTGETR